jgi:hypothetical protein
MKAQALLPLDQAAAASQDPAVRLLIQRASQYLQVKAATTLGYAVRSLGSSFNKLASERKEGLLGAQSADVRSALQDVRPGFNTFFEGDVSPVLTIAAQTTQLRMTQTALSKLGSGSSRRPRDQPRSSRAPHRNGGRRHGGRSYNNNNSNYNNNNNNNSSRDDSSNRQDNKKKPGNQRGGGGRRPRGGKKSHYNNKKQ